MVRKFVNSRSTVPLALLGWLIAVGLVQSSATAEAENPETSCHTDEAFDDTAITWLNESTDPSADAYGAVIIAKFGEALKSDPLSQLRRGYIGTAIDDVHQRLAIVVDPTLVDIRALQSDLDALAQPLTALATSSCFSAADLLDSGKKVLDEGIMRPIVGHRYSVELSPYSSQWIVYAEPDSLDQTAWDETFDGSVDLRVSEFVAERQAGGRSDDSEPHWGGSRIGRNSAGAGGEICTSGVTVDTQSSGKAMLTAAHCFNSGNSIISGSHGYGSVTQEAIYPLYDLAVLNGANQNYDDDVYANPIRGTANPYDVKSSGNASVADHVCLSGGWSHTTCGLLVKGTNASLCDADGCTNVLLRYNKNGSACQPGDSGAPIFSRVNGNTQAKIRAQHVGEISNGCVGEKVSSILSGLNVAIATSP